MPIKDYFYLRSVISIIKMLLYCLIPRWLNFGLKLLAKLIRRNTILKIIVIFFQNRYFKNYLSYIAVLLKNFANKLGIYKIVICMLQQCPQKTIFT